MVMPIVLYVWQRHHPKKEAASCYVISANSMIEMHFTDQRTITSQCPDCQIQFSSNEAFQLHYEEQHRTVKIEPDDYHDYHQSSGSSKGKPKAENETPDVKKFACQNCSFTTKTEHLLQEHIRTQHNPHRKMYSCNLCDYFCLQERTFNLHKLKHSELDAKFACDQCGKLFLSMGIMKRHALTHNKLKPFFCDVEGCGERFNIKSRLTDHVRYVHMRSRSHGKSQKESNSSPKADDTVLGLSSRKSGHDKTEGCTLQHSDNESKAQNNDDNVYQDATVKTEEACPALSTRSVNNFIFPTQAKRDFQMKEETPSDAITVYDIVLSSSQRSNSKNAVESNINISTTPLVSEYPEVVPPIFLSGNQYLKMATKSKISKFVCPMAGCGKSFRDNFNLHIHTCTHTGEMQRACKLCGYTCVQKSALDKHMKVHENERRKTLLN